jgi:predicted  nucleic acid-binding Zn-ribbon protein
MNHAANRESYRLVPETCPNIDKALHDAEEAIKEQTSMLRDALTEAIERYQDAEELVDELEIKVQSLENDLEYYKELCERYDRDD